MQPIERVAQNMPVITIIDEQRAAIDKVGELAQLGLAAPETAVHALAAIAAVVADTKDAVQAIVRELS